MGAVRVTSVNEVQFLTCIQHRVWGSNTPRFANWEVGDYLIFVVERAIAGIAEVIDEPFYSEAKIWAKDVLPYRIPIRFVYALGPEIRPPIYGNIWDALTSAWGKRYGWGLATQSELPGEAAEVLFDAVQMRPNELAKIQANLETHLDRARQWLNHQQIKLAQPKPLVKPQRKTSHPSALTAHSQAQSELVQLGKVTGCSVWVATNDRNRMYKGKRLGEGSLEHFPNLGLTQEARDRIALIDIIWIKRNMPVYAFEVEVTSTVYSGLLRMSDLVAMVPLLNIKLFIVAPRKRQQKVMRELARPTFQKIGLDAYCRFVATEDLAALLEKIENLGGHIQPSVMDTIAVALESNQEEMESNSGS